MSTTLVLVGGSEHDAPTYYGERLSRELSMRVQAPKILSCNFAKPNKIQREKSTGAWEQWFRQHFPESLVTIADENNWLSQVNAADVIYLHGGETKTLFEKLSNFSESRKIFENKIVIGSSAGANYLAHSGYSPKAGVFVEGIGLADVSVLVHYGSEEKADIEAWGEIRRKVSKKFGKPVVCLSEGEYTVLEI